MGTVVICFQTFTNLVLSHRFFGFSFAAGVVICFQTFTNLVLSHQSQGAHY